MLFVTDCPHCLYGFKFLQQKTNHSTYFLFCLQKLSTCNEGEDSPNTLVTGLIINGCLLVAFFLVLFYFNNHRRFHFYFDLYFRRIRGTRKPSQKYTLKDGLRLALRRLTTGGVQDEEICVKKDSYNISFEKLSLTLTSVSSLTISTS